MHFRFAIEFEIGKEAPRQSATSDSWRRLRKIVKHRDGTICQLCGNFAPNGEVDHKIPLSRGGSDDLDNLVWTCRDCNMRKGDMTPDEWEEDQPPVLKLDVTQRNGDDGHEETNSLRIKGIDQSQLSQLAREICSGKSLATHAWIGTSKPFTRGQFDILVSELERLNYISPGRGNTPRRLTPLGRSVFQQLAQTPEGGDTDPLDDAA